MRHSTATLPSEHNYSTPKPTTLQQRTNSLEYFRPPLRPPMGVPNPTFQSTFNSIVQRGGANLTKTPLKLPVNVNQSTPTNNSKIAGAYPKPKPMVVAPARIGNVVPRLVPIGRADKKLVPIEKVGPKLIPIGRAGPKLVPVGRAVITSKNRPVVNIGGSSSGVTIRRVTDRSVANPPAPSVGTVTVTPIANVQRKDGHVSIEQLTKNGAQPSATLPQNVRVLYEHLHKLQAQSKQKVTSKPGSIIVQRNINNDGKSKGPVVRTYGAALPRMLSSSVDFQVERTDKENLGKRKLTSQEALAALPNRGVAVKVIKKA